MASVQPMSFGSLLKRYRRAARLTQEELAARAGYSAAYVSLLERNMRLPTNATIAALAEALALTPVERASLDVALLRPSIHSPARVLHARRTFDQPLLVGRAHELVQLDRHLAGEHPPLLLLAGEPGIGKTRLLQETAQCAAETGWTVLEGNCYRSSGQEPYAPLVGALATHLQLQSPAQRRVALEGCAWLVPLLPELAEQAVVPLPRWTLPPEQERRLMFSAVGRFLANVAGPQGTLLVLDDLQWAGADALDLLANLLRAPTRTSLRILGAYRSTEVRAPDPLGVVLADLASAGLAQEEHLLPLPPLEARALLTRVLGVEEGADDLLQEQLLARTGGVPYFLVSCAEALRAGALNGADGSVPWNVAQSIRQRVAALSIPVQDLLGAAAVVGREAPGTLLLALAAQPTGEVIAALEELDRARLLVEGSEARYQFPHDLIREVVLADMSVMRQRHWHRQIAAALEQVPGELPIEQLAYHASQAGDLEKAVIYLERAGDRAAAAYAHTEAESSYRELLRHLEQLDRPLDMARTCEKLGQLLYTAAHLDEAVGVLTRAETTYRTAGDGAGQRRALALLGQVHAEAGTASQGLQLLLPILQEAKPVDAPQGWARVYEAVAFLYHELNQHQESLAAAEQAVAFARLAGDDSLLVAALHRYGEALLNLRRIEEAVQVNAEFLPLAERVGDLGHASRALGTLAYNASMIQGTFEQSRVYYDRALKLGEQVGDLKQVFICLMNRGYVNFLFGDWQAARADSERARALHPWKDEHVLTCAPLLHLGWIALAEGQWTEAKALLEEGLAMAERRRPFFNGEVVGQAALGERDLLEGQPDAMHARLEPFLAHASPEQRALLLPLLAWEALLQGDEGQAEALAVQGLAFARQMRFILPDALRIQALLHLQQARWEEAEAVLEEAMELCVAMPYPYAEAKALYVYGLLHKARGELEQARGRLQAALAILNRLGERLYAEQVERALLSLDPQAGD